MASKSRLQVIDWLKKIHFKGDKVLDLGAGTNYANKYAKVECNSYETMDIDIKTKPKYVYDINEEICCGMLAHFRERYDAIFCIETIEHTWDPVTVFENFNKMLKPGGKLFLSVCYIYPHHGKNDYLRYTDNGLKKLLEKTMFENIEIEARQATTGHRDILRFFQAEGMHSVELRNDYINKVPIGYCVKATKRKE